MSTCAADNDALDKDDVAVLNGNNKVDKVELNKIYVGGLTRSSSVFLDFFSQPLLVRPSYYSDEFRYIGESLNDLNVSVCAGFSRMAEQGNALSFEIGQLSVRNEELSRELQAANSKLEQLNDITRKLDMASDSLLRMEDSLHLSHQRNVKNVMTMLRSFVVVILSTLMLGVSSIVVEKTFDIQIMHPMVARIIAVFYGLYFVMILSRNIVEYRKMTRRSFFCFRDFIEKMGVV